MLMKEDSIFPRLEYKKDNSSAIVYITQDVRTKTCKNLSEIRNAISEKLHKLGIVHTKESEVILRPMLFIASRYNMPAGADANLLHELKLLPERKFLETYWEKPFYLFWRTEQKRRGKLESGYFFKGMTNNNGTTIIRLTNMSFQTLKEGETIIEKLWDRNVITEGERKNMLQAVEERFGMY
jgi:hypothetical protein